MPQGRAPPCLNTCRRDCLDRATMGHTCKASLSFASQNTSRKDPSSSRTPPLNSFASQNTRWKDLSAYSTPRGTASGASSAVYRGRAFQEQHRREHVDGCDKQHPSLAPPSQHTHAPEPPAEEDVVWLCTASAQPCGHGEVPAEACFWLASSPPSSRPCAARLLSSVRAHCSAVAQRPASLQ